MEVKGYHFVGCSVTIEREAIGPAQDDTRHGSTEQLRNCSVRPDGLDPAFEGPAHLGKEPILALQKPTAHLCKRERQAAL